MKPNFTKTGIFLVLFLLAATFVQAKTITGKVLERGTMQPLAGAMIVATSDPNRSVVAGADGAFSIETPDAETGLRVTFIGYVGKEVVLAGASAPLEIVLDTDVLGIDEVVVTGQGAAISRRRISSNVVSVGEEQLSRLPSGRIDEMLQTALPNVQINVTTGQPGGTSIIKSRGFSSAYINSTPVIYVDGVRVDNLNTKATLSMGQSNGAASGSIGDIPIENIERVEYVPGGAATTLYGSDAAGGVIQIFTKKGSTDGRTSSFAEVQFGADIPTSQFYFFDRTKDLLQQTGLIQRYRFGVDGGNEQHGFSIAAGMGRSAGTLIHDNGYNRKFDLSAGFRSQLARNLNYAGSFGAVVNDYGRSRNGNQGGYTGLWFTEGAASTNFGYDPFIDDLDEATYEKMKAFVDRAEELQDASILVRRFQNSHGFTYRPSTDLTFKITAGIDYRASTETAVNTNEYQIWTNARPAGTVDAGSINKYYRNYFGLTFDFNGQWRAEAGDFSFVTTAGAQYFSTDDRQNRITGSNLRDGSITITGAGTTTAGEYWSYLYNYGVFVQENIGFRDKLFLDLGIRSDYNTAFGNNTGWQNYPKIGLSYSLIEEPFMQGLRDRGIVSNLKLRANYGIAGSYPPPFSYQKTIGIGSYLGGQTASFGSLGNPDLGPEKKHSYEAGLDISTLNSRLSFGFTYYYALTKDALFTAPAAPSTGYSTYLANIGEILNRGIELSMIATPIRTRDFEATLAASVNTNHNEVLDIGGGAPFSIGGMSERTLQNAVEVGKPVGFIRGAKAILNPDGSYKESLLLQDLGRTLPTVYGNFNLNLTYKRLSLLVGGDYQAGAYVHSFDRQFRFSKNMPDPSVPQSALPIDPATGQPRAQSAVVWDFSNFFVEKSDYLRLRTISLSYSLPVRRLARAIDLTLTVNNPYTFTKSSVDPEAVLSGPSSQGGIAVGGFNYSTYSTPRQVIGSVRVRF